MGKKKQLEHKQNKFEQHIETVEKKVAKKARVFQQTLKPQQKRSIQETTQKKNLFALDSDDEAQEQTELKTWKLTHNGQDLQEDYNDQVPLSSEEDLPKGFVKNNHFVGFDQNQEKRKSKKEIYDEIIQSSKQRKMEKQKQKEDNQSKLLYLNEALPQILDVLPIKQKWTAPIKDTTDYAELMESFKIQPKVQLETAVQSSEKDQLNYMRQKREEMKRKKKEADKQQIEKDTDDEDDEQVENDDCVSKQFKNEREKKMLKSYKKVEHMQRVMEHLRNVQNRKKNRLLTNSEKQDENEKEDIDEDESENLEEVISNENDDDIEDSEDSDDENDDNEEDNEDDDEGNEDEDDDDIENDKESVSSEEPVPKKGNNSAKRICK